MAFVSAMALGGCSDKKEVVNDVRFTIEANTDQPVRIYSPTDKGETGTVIRKSYESSFKTGPTVFGIEARCDDETTLITIRVQQIPHDGRNTAPISARTTSSHTDRHCPAVFSFPATYVRS